MLKAAYERRDVETDEKGVQRHANTDDLLARPWEDASAQLDN